MKFIGNKLSPGPRTLVDTGVANGAYGRAGAPNAGLLKTTAIVFLASTLLGCMGWVPGRQTYWDAKVKEMCEKDGGVTVYERTTISVKQTEELPKIEGSISIPHQSLAKLTAPLISTDSEEVLRESGPRVVRRERVVIRQSDRKVVGKMVSYSRIGGDFPTGISEGTSFTCPEYKNLYAEQGRFFVIKKSR